MNYIKSFIEYIVKQLPSDGGPSATRWVFIRTAEVISLGWIALTVGAVYRYVRFGTTDAIYCGMVLTLGAGLFAFAQNAQVTKLSLDSKSPGASSSATLTPLSSTVTSGETAT